MFLEALSAAKDLGRVHEIASILVHCGFGDIVRRIGLSHALETAGKTIHWKYAEETACLLPHQRARRALEKLGPTFVKLERFGERLDRAASRLTIGMITAAFIIGTSIMMSVSGDTEYLGMTILASFGFAMATLGGVWVLVSIWRGRR